jgi:hypothetical protein
VHKAKDRDVLHISWLLECERQRARVPLRPRYYLHMSHANLRVRVAEGTCHLACLAANLPAGAANCLPCSACHLHQAHLNSPLLLPAQLQVSDDIDSHGDSYLSGVRCGVAVVLWRDRCCGQ